MNKNAGCFNYLEDEFIDNVTNAKRAVTISIASGKGGVGKTSIALRLSMDLAKVNKKVLLIDCDYNLSNTLIKLNLPVDDRFFYFVRSEKSFFEVVHKIGTLHIFPGCSGNVDLFEKNISYDKLIMSIINEYESVYDYIILDSAAGVSKETLNLNAYTQYRVVVINPNKSSITDSYSLVKLLKMRFGIRENHVLVNRYISDKQYHKAANALIGTAKHFLGCDCHLIGGIKEISNDKGHIDDFWINDSESDISNYFLKTTEHIPFFNQSTLNVNERVVGL